MITHLGPDILECEVKWALESITMNKANGGDGISVDDDWGVSWVFSSCGASVGFLTRYDGELREPLVRRQRSQASMRVARQIVSLLWSHGRD